METISLLSNYPNPFNASTTIEFGLAKTGHVSLSVYDLLGRKIAVLIDVQKQEDSQEVQFESSGLSSGVYFHILRVGDDFEIRKMNLLK